jgi:hypothetical protein
MCGGDGGGGSSGLVVIIAVAAAVGNGCYVWSMSVIVIVEVGMCLLTVAMEQSLQPQS